MQHDPNAPDFVQAQLNEVIAAAQRSELLENSPRINLAQHGQDRQIFKTLKQFNHPHAQIAPVRTFMGWV